VNICNFLIYTDSNAVRNTSSFNINKKITDSLVIISISFVCKEYSKRMNITNYYSVPSTNFLSESYKYFWYLNRVGARFPLNRLLFFIDRISLLSG
jgi:hypothetical protein